VFGPRPANVSEHERKHRRVGILSSATRGMFANVVSYFEDSHHLSVFGVDLFIDDLFKQLDL
jgi:hypothetical protein